MTKQNPYIIPKEVNKKPSETVYELKSENTVPSYEEFMKTYKSDGEVNYADLESGDIREAKGYGPCKNTLCGCSCSSETCICKSVSVKIGDNGGGTSASGRGKT